MKRAGTIPASTTARQAAGKTSELLLLEGAPHAFQVQWRGEANRRANDAMDAFLARHLLA